MRKVWIIISLAVVFVLFTTFRGLLLPNNSTVNTVEEAIQKSGRNVVKVVHSEEVKGGVVVFYKKGIGNGGVTNASGYIKMGLGWRTF
jgi:hypothetical protein